VVWVLLFLAAPHRSRPHGPQPALRTEKARASRHGRILHPPADEAPPVLQR